MDFVGQNGLPTQVAQIVHAPKPEKPYIVQLMASPSGLMGLDQYGSTYAAMTTNLTPPRLFWQMVIKEIT